MKFTSLHSTATPPAIPRDIYRSAAASPTANAAFADAPPRSAPAADAAGRGVRRAAPAAGMLFPGESRGQMAWRCLSWTPACAGERGLSFIVTLAPAMASLFQGPWSDEIFNAAFFFVSHKDTKPRRCRASREAAFLCGRAASRTVDMEIGPVGRSRLLRVFVRKMNWRRSGRTAPGHGC